MPESPMVVSRALREALGALEPEVISGDDCARLAEELARTEKACGAARARLAARAAAAGAHHRRGYANPVDWLATTSGSSAPQAREVLGAATAVEDCPATKEAVIAGELSLAQGAEIARTEAACPGTEAELLGLAKASSLQVLLDSARHRRLRAMDPEELHARQQAARELRHWRDELGMVRVAGALPPTVGIPLINRLEAETDRIRKATRREGSDEARAAHAADALVGLVASKVTGSARRAELVVVWQRPGDGAEGTCHLVGGGPVPVGVARALAEEASFKAVVHDGLRIETVQHFGRYIPAELRTALELGGPPEFDGVVCVDCGKRHGIQIDHVDPVANRGPTSQRNLKGRCWDCHQRKTEEDRKAGLLGGGTKGQRPEPP